MELKDLLLKLKNYSIKDQEIINKAYSYAKNLHEGQFRQSGKPYITHPLNVACILADMNADADTICAGLLHDTLEDTPITKEDIAEDFNKNIANLVDGVTKISKMNFSSKQEQTLANTRKIITGITTDVRIIIIKLADRLHNMRTLEYKSEFKQKENAMETMDIFVPLAYCIGAYHLKNELEDISLRYLYPEKYKRIENIKLKIEHDSEHCLNEMLKTIHEILMDKKIPHEIKVRTKNIYGIYKRMEEGDKLSDIHDLLALKVMVDNISSCYQTLGLVHSKYHPINERFKDYIYNPKTNMYQSLHTTVFGEDGRLVQTQIRTFDMDKVASLGLTAYWNLKGDEARNVMQENLKEKYQFFQSLIEINKVFGANQEFVSQVKKELFADKIYVYTPKGDIIELPKGATVIDFAYAIHSDLGDTLVGAIVNEKNVDVDYVLHNKDRVKVITDILSFGPREEWLEKAQTTRARRKIREFNKNN